MKRLALFTSHPSVHNTLRYFALKRAFAGIGVTVAGGPMAPTEDALAVFCREFRPDAIMEMDRTRHHHGNYLDKKILHIAWIVHPDNRHGPVYRDSELLYAMDASFLPGQAADYGAKHLGWLPAGADPHHFSYGERDWRWDVSFIGHMGEDTSFLGQRRLLLARLGNLSSSVGFYGSGDWSELACHFQGKMDNPEEVCTLYQSSRLNIHDGVLGHFRVMDCMAAGGVVCHWQEESPSPPLFQPDIHYVAVNDGNLDDKIAYHLNHPAGLRRMATAAAAEVADKHTWHHRVVKIMQDWQGIQP